jgi:putative effector of murein hydrolase LrgA (UPF0299 family)/DNA-directed RNA polymerase subunit RPC12/RpoP
MVWTILFIGLIITAGIYVFVSFPRQAGICKDREIWRWPLTMASVTPRALLSVGIAALSIDITGRIAYLASSASKRGILDEVANRWFTTDISSLAIPGTCIGFLLLCWLPWARRLHRHAIPLHPFTTLIQLLWRSMLTALLLFFVNMVAGILDIGSGGWSRWWWLSYNGIILSLTALWWTIGCLGWLLFRWPSFRDAEWMVDGSCIKCGYDLRGTVAVGRRECPECGSPIVDREVKLALDVADYRGNS